MRARSAIFGYAVLTVLVTAGAAQGLSGTNTVFSDDIVDGTISTPDIKTGAISGSTILDNAVTGTDINEATIPGFKKTYFARVKASGVLVDGDATDADDAGGTGEYKVTFPFNVRPCSALASGALFPGTDVFSHSSAGTTGLETNGLVEVHLRSADGTGVDSSFTVQLVCP